MTQEEHNILIENNRLLKQILSCINNPNQDIKEFAINVIANLVSNQNNV